MTTLVLEPHAPAITGVEPVVEDDVERDPRWVRPAFVALLVGTGVMYLWGLGASGWANSYYSMAVQAGTKSWKAFFYGSLDAGNSITVDKTPASLWVMGISARLFGVNAWSILVPQALEGVATVAVLYAAVKRWFGAPAALLAGAVMALTPVSTLMFRFNNPDALLVLLLVAGAYGITRALERGSTWWLVLAFSCVGFGFLTKELQALLVVPAFGFVYLLAGPPKLGRRIAQLAIGALALFVSAGWWIAIVQLTPASARPYIGGSQTNSLWNVIFGYNGFGRLTGNERGSVGGGPAGAGGQWGPTGWLRMFNGQFGAQASWLIPAAVIFLIAGLAFTIKTPRTDHTRAALLLWGGWLLITGLAFSFGQGIIHPYYTLALAPAIGALVGIGATRLWAGRVHAGARAVLCLAIALSALWAYWLLKRVPSWHPELRVSIAIAGVLGVLAVAVSGHPLVKRASVVVAALALFAGLAAPAAYSLHTATRPREGAIPSAGPASASSQFPGGGGPRPAGGGARAFGPGGGFRNRVGQFPGGFTPPQFNGSNRAGGPGGGLLNASKPSAELTAALQANANEYTWVAATVGANSAAGYQLASGDPVMAIGGFNGTDPSPTLAQFQQYVAQHKIHYFIGGGGFGGGRGGFGGFGGFGGGGPNASGATTEISQWVEQNFSAQTIGGVTVYDLTTQG